MPKKKAKEQNVESVEIPNKYIKAQIRYLFNAPTLNVNAFKVLCNKYKIPFKIQIDKKWMNKKKNGFNSIQLK